LVTPEGQTIEAFRPTVIVKSSFISSMIAQGKLKLSSDVELSDEATDEKFKKLFFDPELIKEADGNEKKRIKLSVDSFVKEFSLTDLEDESKELAEKEAAAAKEAEDKAAKEAADKAAKEAEDKAAKEAADKAAKEAEDKAAKEAAAKEGADKAASTKDKK